MSGMLHDPKKHEEWKRTRGNNPTSLNEARNEMRRLMAIMMRLNKRYLEREREVIALHSAGRQNYSGHLSTVLTNDLQLRDASGAAKTCATLVQGISAYILAEIAMKQSSGMLAAEQIGGHT